MADNLTQVLSTYTVYIDSTSLMHGSMEFFKISLYNVLRNTNRKLKVVDFVIKDLQKLQFSDNEKFAVKALKIIDFYRDKGLVEDIVSSKTEQGKILDVIYNNRTHDNSNVCLITDNKDQANEIVTSLSNSSEVDFNHKIAAVRLINGPALWDIKTVKPRVMPIGKQDPLDYSKGFGFNETPKKEEPTVEVQKEPKVVTPTPTPTITPTFKQEEPKVEEVKVEEVKEPVKEAFVPRQNTRSKRNKLVVSMIVDNSSSLTDEREMHLKKALAYFNDKLQANEIKTDLELAVYGFDGFSPRVLKGYDGDLDINRFDNGGIQVLGKTIDLAMSELADRQKLYAAHNIETHRPWLIVLADGSAYGDLSPTAEKLKKVLKDRKITYFPFSLNPGQLDDSLEPLARLKMFLKVKDDMFMELFDFLFNTLETRINTPKDDLMTLDKKAISGFIAR